MLKLETKGHAFAGFGAPFTATEALDAATDTKMIPSKAIGSLAALWDRLVGFKDIFIFFVGISVIHQIFVARAANDTVYDRCASSSVLALMYFLVAVSFTAIISIVRSVRPLSVMFELAVTLLNVVTATAIAAASGPHRWALKLGESDYCSAQNNSLSALEYLFADVLGSGSVVALALIVLVKPPGGSYGLLWVLALAIVAILLQLTVIDPYLVEELSSSWKFVENNGTSADSEISDLTNRLSGLEELFNTTATR